MVQPKKTGKSYSYKIGEWTNKYGVSVRKYFVNDNKGKDRITTVKKLKNGSLRKYKQPIKYRKQYKVKNKSNISSGFRSMF